MMIIEGVVIGGKKLGTTLGFPTANVMLNKDIASSIVCGVYAVKVMLGGVTYKGVANVGHRPTVEDASDSLLEVHILDFNRDIYGEYIKVELLSFIRTESKFNSLEELKKAIKNDILLAKLV